MITPVGYHLAIEPNLNDFKFLGKMTLTACVDDPTEVIDLDCAELAIWWCRLQSDDAEDSGIDCPFTLDPAEETLSIHLPAPRVGTLKLKISYTGKINNRMAGFYRSRIQTNIGQDHIAVTQFQESDARRAFPCLDHPAKKAIFSLSMVIGNELTAISNTGIQSATDLENGKQRVDFHPTPKMSTYLLFFGVGPFEIHTDEVDPRVRAVCLPGMGDQTVFGREFGRKALSYGEAYYAIDYPLDKMDLIAVPDFAFGAMENWGAITFRENLLLDIPGVTSREARARICEVIAHEITHQWFGNLVTPEEWKYLWLNESFATYFGFGMVDYHHRDWEIWHQFVRTQTETAMVRDAFHETFAIEMPEGADVAITSSTAPIIYSKGGSILRQLEAWIGPDSFKAGLRRYLTDFAYGCAASHHLWESLSAAAQMPVSELMRNWVTQPGFPLLTVEREKDKLRFHQERFTYLPYEGKQTWMIPVSLTTFDAEGNASDHDLLLETDQVEFNLPPETATYKINADQSGFYIVQYKDKENLDQLAAMVKRQELGSMDRWGLQNDLFALVKAAKAPMGIFLNVAEQYMSETGYLPLSSLESHLFESVLVLEGAYQQKAIGRAGSLIVNALDRVGWKPRAEETQNTAMLRDQLLHHGALIGIQPILDFLNGLFKGFLEGIEVPPDIFKSVMTAWAVKAEPSTLEAMIHCLEKSEVEHERMTIVSALGAFGSQELLEKALVYALKEVPDRIRFLPLVSAAGNPAATDRLWSWFEDQMHLMEKMHPLLFERVVAAFVPVPGLADPERTRSFCHRLSGQQPRLKDIVALSLERLEVNVRWRDRER